MTPCYDTLFCLWVGQMGVVLVMIGDSRGCVIAPHSTSSSNLVLQCWTDGGSHKHLSSVHV